MKKILIISRLVAVVGVAVVSCRAHAQTLNQSQAAIDAALKERKAARSLCRFQRQVPQSHFLAPTTYANQTTFRPGEFIAMLRDIDTSACPSDFRAAWLNYIQTLDVFYFPSRAEKNRINVLKDDDKTSFGVSIGAPWGLSTSYENTTKRLLAREYAVFDPQRAFHHLESVALSYGVQD